VLFVSVKSPVGVGLPVPPLTGGVTVSPCVVVMFNTDGVTFTVGTVLARVTLSNEVAPRLAKGVTQLCEKVAASPAGNFVALSVTRELKPFPLLRMIVFVQMLPEEKL